MDPRGHGTMVGGIVGARGNANGGTAGVVYEGGPSMVGCKLVEGQEDAAFALNAYECLSFCQAVGADITVNSWGLDRNAAFDEALFGLFRSYNTALHVVAAGNGGSLFEAGNRNEYLQNGRYIYDRNAPGGATQPGAYSGLLPNVITVGAVNGQGTNRARFSEYGISYVDVWAPGVDIVSTMSVASNLWFAENALLNVPGQNGCFPQNNAFSINLNTNERIPYTYLSLIHI